jgi:tellurite resistance protein TerC
MEFLTSAWLGTPLWMWLGFIAIVFALMALDLGVLNRKAHEIGVRESLLMSAFYIGLGLAFGAWIWWYLGPEPGMLYVTGFVVEKSLAMDNVFVIAMIFAFFGVPRIHQHRVLLWGIIGVIILRGIMIGVGATLVSQFYWVLYIFAAFLIYTGYKMWRHADQEYDVASSPIYKWATRRFRVTDGLRGQRFFVKEVDPATGKVVRFMTPLFLCLLMVEFADVIFAVDSVPAIFAITTDPFLVYTSNIFAILGLRALYFALAAMVDRFHYLKYALSVLLIFIGAKIFVADMLGLAKIPPPVSLGVTFAILTAGVVYSLYKTRGHHVPPTGEEVPAEVRRAMEPGA